MRGLAAAVLLVVGVLAAGCGDEKKASPGADPGGREVTLGSGGTKIPRRPARAPARPRPVRRPAASGPSRPAIVSKAIPFPAKRRAETITYTRRHYGRAVSMLHPKVIVEHYTVTPTLQGTYDLFARDAPDVELHELPGVCSHFVVDRDGTIYQLVPLTQICRHTVGLNQVAIGIEHVGSSDAQVLGDAPQLRASLRLTAWLRCRYGIAMRDVIGHNESLSSPYHHENVAALKRQTHDDFQAASMSRYRRELSSRRC